MVLVFMYTVMVLMYMYVSFQIKDHFRPMHPMLKHSVTHNISTIPKDLLNVYKIIS